ncbi:MAG: nucleotidyltransferase domain-containing protein [Actinobacteria bacterium]|nr:nucleotidyltransferase domain-containing protein [Actinomycetota bacterium]
MVTYEPLRRLLVRAEADPAVLAVLLFGSRARDEASNASDVDVCLVLRPEAGVSPSEERLRYLAEFDLDVHVFQELPLYIRSRVLKEGRVLLAKDEDALYELAIRTAKAFEDFKPQYRRYLEAVLGA